MSFPSFDAPGGQPVLLSAHWHPVATAPKAPALVLLHGCGGMQGRDGQPSERMRRYTRLLNDEGWHVLVVDSLGPRGERELCTQRTGARAVTLVQRRLDALASLQWLAQRPEVDAGRLGLLGWSNGGSAVLAATNRKHRAVAAAPVLPAFAVAFYPGCAAELRRGYEPVAPLLMLVGEADDWTPAEPCRRLAARSAQIEIEAYAGAHHGFDSDAPVRLRRDVPNGVSPGQGVHVGGHAEALRASHERLLRFLRSR
ncbi:MAG TPA: dienelactone hydrolase family protein [Rhizobacter sp.]